MGWSRIAIVSVFLLSSLLWSISNCSARKASRATSANNLRVQQPNQYMGRVRHAYAAAAQLSGLFRHLFCYAGDDVTDHHNCLLDCFTSSYAADDPIPCDEALLAEKLHKEGRSLKQIQKEIDETFSKWYPYEQDSPALKKYKATRYK